MAVCGPALYINRKGSSLQKTNKQKKNIFHIVYVTLYHVYTCLHPGLAKSKGLGLGLAEFHVETVKFSRDFPVCRQSQGETGDW